MAGFVAALLTQASDRAPWLSARLADQFATRRAVIVAVALAVAASNAIGAAGGALVAPLMTPNARALLLGLAMLSAGMTALWPAKPLPQPGGRSLGVFATAAMSLLAMSMGDRTQLLTAAITARSNLPAFAAIGATLGTLAVHIPAIVAGEQAGRRLPTRAVSVAIAALFILAGAIALLSALRLI